MPEEIVGEGEKGKLKDMSGGGDASHRFVLRLSVRTFGGKLMRFTFWELVNSFDVCGIVCGDCLVKIMVLRQSVWQTLSIYS